MPSRTLELEDALLAPGRTPEQLYEKEKAVIAVNLYRSGSASLDEAAGFAAVPKAWLLELIAEERAELSLTNEELGRDAERYISVDPGTLSGTPCLKGTRVPAHYIADMVASGDSVIEILVAYPYLTEGQVHAAVAYTRAFPWLARPVREPAWRRQQPIESSEIPLNDLPPFS